MWDWPLRLGNIRDRSNATTFRDTASREELQSQSYAHKPTTDPRLCFSNISKHYIYKPFFFFSDSQEWLMCGVYKELRKVARDCTNHFDARNSLIGIFFRFFFKYFFIQWYSWWPMSIPTREPVPPPHPFYYHKHIYLFNLLCAFNYSPLLWPQERRYSLIKSNRWDWDVAWRFSL